MQVQVFTLIYFVTVLPHLVECAWHVRRNGGKEEIPDDLYYARIEVTKCKKCGKIIVEPKKLRN